jgi:hypothetical protein
MSDLSTHSPETSAPKSLFGKAERRYLTRLAPALQNPPEPLTVAMWLEKAQAEGLDPQRIYESAVACRPPHWTKAPSFHDVMNQPAELRHGPVSLAPLRDP